MNELNLFNYPWSWWIETKISWRLFDKRTKDFDVIFCFLFYCSLGYLSLISYILRSFKYFFLIEWLNSVLVILVVFFLIAINIYDVFTIFLQWLFISNPIDDLILSQLHLLVLFFNIARALVLVAIFVCCKMFFSLLVSMVNNVISSMFLIFLSYWTTF